MNHSVNLIVAVMEVGTGCRAGSGPTKWNSCRRDSFQKEEESLEPLKDKEGINWIRQRRGQMSPKLRGMKHGYTQVQVLTSGWQAEAWARKAGVAKLS